MLNHLPEAPHWRPALDESWPWVAALKNCQQNPIHHAEGDVWTHTQMVLEQLLADPEYRQLPPEERRILYLAALLHDLAKPVCTQPDGSSPGHARKGAQMARRMLFLENTPPARREAACNLIRYHMVAYRLIDQADWLRQWLALSLTTDWRHLRLLARADARGRICQDQQKLLDQIELFAQLAQENPPQFPDDHSRVTYFRRGGDPTRQVYDDTRCQVIVMSGLPASGKDHYRQTHLADWPHISLDDLRLELDIDSNDNQAAVIVAAREQAREYLRQARNFVWNATNLSHSLRQRTLNLCYDYGANLRIVYCEAPLAELERRNQQRPRPVPARALERMMSQWELPDLSEAHQVVQVGL